MDKGIVALSLAAALACGCLAACTPATDGKPAEAFGGSAVIAKENDGGIGAARSDATGDAAGTGRQAPAEAADGDGYSIDAGTGVIETPYYTVRIDESWRGHYKAWFLRTDLDPGEHGDEDHPDMGCSLMLLLVDADDPSEPPTEEELWNADGAYSVSLFTDTWGSQGDYSVVRLGAPKSAPGWHVEVSGPYDSSDMTDALAGRVTLK